MTYSGNKDKETRFKTHSTGLRGWPVNIDRMPYNPLALLKMPTPRISSTPMCSGRNSGKLRKTMLKRLMLNDNMALREWKCKKR